MVSAEEKVFDLSLTRRKWTLAQQWNDVGLIDLENCARGAIQGKKRDTVSSPRFRLLWISLNTYILS